MYSTPIENDIQNPLISVLISNYDQQHLSTCLDSIFLQDILTNIEIILIDDATNDGSWDTALEYADKYPGIMTIRRNKKVHGPDLNLHHCTAMAKGRFYVPLSGNQAFLPEYVGTCVQSLKTDPYAQFNLVRRITELSGIVCRFTDSFLPAPNLMERPLVSILCYNYNYGRYLRQCLKSVFSQTYGNIELCFSDNASTDDSWNIALEFAKKYPHKMYLTRNRKNFGSDDNFANCQRVRGGKYYVALCSDDVLEPEFVTHCVDALEAHPNTGLAIVNRTIIDEHSRRTEEPPFYNKSCIIPGEAQAAVYMMAGINPSISQIMYRESITHKRVVVGGLAARHYGTRILDFNISIDFDIAYIKDNLLLHRIHSQSDTSQADKSLMTVIGIYVLNHQFAEIASARNLTNVTDRLSPSLEKLAHLAVRYSVRSLLGKDEKTAQKYFCLAMAIHLPISDDPVWKKLQDYWAGDPAAKAKLLYHFRNSNNLAARSISYDPPQGSIPIAKLTYETQH